MSNVSDDRDFLKNYLKNLNSTPLETMKNDNFTYIDAFLKYKPKTNNCEIKKKIKNLSTINILYSLYFTFQKLNKKEFKNINKLRDELKNRDDLFDKVVEFSENNEIVFDDLYCWYPGLKYSDIFSLIFDILPNLLEKYKIYLVKNLILGNKPMTRILEIFKSRLNKNMHNFEIINKDLLLFNIENNAFCTGFEEIEPLRIKRKDKGKLEINKKIQKENFPAYNTFYKIVSGSYWTVEDDFDECNEVLDIFGSIEKCKKYNDDIDLVLLPSISYIDIIYKEKLITCTMVQMNDLIVKNNRSKKFWIENEVINSNWDYL